MLRLLASQLSPGRKPHAANASASQSAAAIAAAFSSPRARILLVLALLGAGCLPFLLFGGFQLGQQGQPNGEAPRRHRREPLGPKGSKLSADFGVKGGVPKADEPLSFSFEANSLLWRRLKGGPQQQRQAKAHGSGSSSSESQNHDDQQDRPALATLSEAEVTAAGFNWRGYLLRNGDLRKQGIRTPSAAYRHFLEKGKVLGRRHDRLRVILRYSACQGLFNQVYAHLAAFMLADKLDADIVLPPSLYRQSFNQHFSTDPEHNQVKWLPAPVGHLFDVDHVRASLAERGRAVMQTPRSAPLPDCNQPQYAYPQYTQPHTLDIQTTMLHDVYMASQSLDDLWDRAADAVMHHYQTLTGSGYPDDVAIVLDLPSTFFAVMTMDSLPAAQAAASMLRFNRTLLKMAAQVREKAGLERARFNGLHLRLETDAADWLKVFGGTDQYMRAYSDAMARAGFATTKQASSSQADDERLQDSSDRIQQASQQEGQATKQDGKQTDSQKQGSGSSVGKGRELQTQAVGAASAGTTQKSSSNAGEVVAQGKGRDLYVASGLLAYATPEQKAGLFEFLQPFASKVHYKELYLAQEELAALNSEQVALLDFLVLAEARTFVGLGSSTFSVYLREYRKLAGFNRKGDNVFVSSKAVGTDVMFQRSTHIVGAELAQATALSRQGEDLLQGVQNQDADSDADL